MDDIRIALVAAAGGSKDAYIKALSGLGIKYDIVDSIKELFDNYGKIRFNGFLLDVPTLLRSGATDKAEANLLVDNFPVLRLNYRASSGIRCIPSGRFSCDVSTLDGFLSKCCRNFPARSLRSSKRANKNLNALLHRNLNAPGSQVEKSVSLNFSTEGGFFFSVSRWQKGDMLWVVIRELSDKTPIKSRVQWVAPWGVKDQIPGIGVQFLGMSEEQADQMDDLIQDK